MLMACGGGEKTPVDKLRDIFKDESLVKAFAYDKPDDEFKQKVKTLIEENADYVLTDKDKIKIRDMFKDLFDAVVKEKLKFQDVPDEMVKSFKNEVSLQVMKITDEIKGLEKFGELENKLF